MGIGNIGGLSVGTDKHRHMECGIDSYWEVECGVDRQ